MAHDCRQDDELRFDDIESVVIGKEQTIRYVGREPRYMAH